jgi:tRNA-uridine 2-sulfurtransferase
MQKNGKNKKVFVGLSGGVDSSVSAFLLKKAGYDVTGVFIKAWYPDFYPCNWRDEMRDAMRICAKLEIPYLTCDLESEYKTEVIDYLISEYKIGRTPNPDVMCNKHIKFKGFLDFAIKNGADFVATGHYAKKITDEKIVKMFIPKDLEKDQTYFLWTLDQEKLQKILFPLGDLEKKEVRKIALENKLHTAEKKDSQGLCFIGHVDIGDFLKRFIDIQNGDVLNEDGQKIGIHDGSIIYTIGQRHGFKILKNNNEEEKYYVISKDIQKNTITVSTKLKIENKNNKFELQDINFTRDIYPNELDDLDIRIRYRSKFNKAKLKENIIEILDLDQELALGQSIVFYKNQECLGGGVLANKV